MVVVEQPIYRSADFSSVTTVCLALAKRVFQVHSVDASGRGVAANSVRRNNLLEFFASLPPCLGTAGLAGQFNLTLRGPTV